MGQSTNAILAFGIDLGEDVEWSLEPDEGEGSDDCGDYETWLAVKFGGDACAEPTVEYNDRNKAKFSKVWDARREFMKGFPVEVVSHCSHDYPMYVLAVPDTVTITHRGCPEAIEVEDLNDAIPTDKLIAYGEMCLRIVEALGGDEFLSDHNFEGELPGPQWLLFSDWC